MPTRSPARQARHSRAHVVRLVVDEEAGDYADPEILAAVGIVPEIGE